MRFIRKAIWNDAMFLSKCGIMDYSLLLAIENNPNEVEKGVSKPDKKPKDKTCS